MRILITRPYDSALKTAQFLEQKGYQTYIEPVFDCHFDDEKLKTIDYTLYDGCVITSFTLTRYMTKHHLLAKSLPLYCAGQQSADCAKQSGYPHVYSSTPFGVQHLLEMLVNHKRRHLLYLHGNHVKMDLSKSAYLCAHHVAITSIKVYTTHSVQWFSTKILDHFHADEIDIITCFSNQTAKILYDLIIKHDLKTIIQKNCTFLCYSKEIADTIRYRTGGQFKTILNDSIPLY